MATLITNRYSERRLLTLSFGTTLWIDALSQLQLEGKVALITGGASGIGEATARLFIRQGAKVVVADIQDERGQSLCKELSTRNQEKVIYIHCEVSCESDVQAAVDLAVSRYGKLDIMYNNAGFPGKPSFSILDTAGEDLKKVFEVNVLGAFFGAKHAARVMIPEKKGVILFTSSVVSVISDEISHPYTASKHAVVGLTKNLCIELGKHGIRVNCISPYGIATPMFTNITKLEKKEAEDLIYAAANLKQAVLEAEDIAEAALYLASDEAKYVSGVNLVIDGGFSLTNPTFTTALKSRLS